MLNIVHVTMHKLFEIVLTGRIEFYFVCRGSECVFNINNRHNIYNTVEVNHWRMETRLTSSRNRKVS